jgi:hypothetical protein
MKHSIEKMKAPLVFLNDSKKEVIQNGYAFIDEMGQTIIIVYGEGYRDLMSKYLNADGDKLNIKYKCYDLDRR